MLPRCKHRACREIEGDPTVEVPAAKVDRACSTVGNLNPLVVGVAKRQRRHTGRSLHTRIKPNSEYRVATTRATLMHLHRESIYAEDETRHWDLQSLNSRVANARTRKRFWVKCAR